MYEPKIYIKYSSNRNPHPSRTHVVYWIMKSSTPKRDITGSTFHPGRGYSCSLLLLLSAAYCIYLPFCQRSAFSTLSYGNTSDWLGTIYYVLCPMYYALCTISSVLFTPMFTAYHTLVSGLSLLDQNPRSHRPTHQTKPHHTQHPHPPHALLIAVHEIFAVDLCLSRLAAVQRWVELDDEGELDAIGEAAEVLGPAHPDGHLGGGVVCSGGRILDIWFHYMIHEIL
jgi:hypothetical protein